jgi:uncharacterized protein (TIGR02271 family)
MSSKEEHILGQHQDHHETNARREESGTTIRLREEELAARKRSVEAGQVTVGTDVVQEQKTLEVPVNREEVTIERHAVDRRPSNEPIAETTDALRVPVHEEQLTAEKRAVVYEEVNVGKSAVHDTEHVSATVRKEVVDVDAKGNLQVAGPESDRR